VTRTLYFVTRVMLAGQILTGLFIWWKRPANVDGTVRRRPA
jgi:hypothetical protein